MTARRSLELVYLTLQHNRRSMASPLTGNDFKNTGILSDGDNTFVRHESARGEREVATDHAIKTWYRPSIAST